MVVAMVQKLVQRLQDVAKARGCGHVSIAAAAGLMFFVSCPLAMVAVAAPYWTGAQEMGGVTVSVSASLWTVSTSTEADGASASMDIAMCGDEMRDSWKGCAEIEAVRFFTVTALLCALVSAMVLSVAFSPKLKAQEAKLCIAGACFASVACVFNFLGMCVASTVAMPPPYSLSGPGFAFLVLELLLNAIGVAVLGGMMANWSSTRDLLERLRHQTKTRGCGKLRILLVGVLMMFCASPMSIVAVAAPYWTAVQQAHGVTVTSSASLWTVSTSTEGKDASAGTSVDICGEEMEHSEIDCGKIAAIRFFTVVGLLVEMSSSVMFLLAFSPVFKAKAWLERKLCMVGVGLSVGALLFTFLGLCLTASVDVSDSHRLSGAGLLFLSLKLPITACAIAVAFVLLRVGSQSSQSPVVDIAPVLHPRSPTSPTILSARTIDVKGGKTLPRSAHLRSEDVAESIAKAVEMKAVKASEPHVDDNSKEATDDSMEATVVKVV